MINDNIIDAMDFMIECCSTPEERSGMHKWPKIKFDRTGFQVAWMDDGTEDRVPKDAIACPGRCENCGMCFQLPTLQRDVVFHKH